MANREPLVYLVGAGPGHPGLITLRGVECLARADLVLYDQLVAEQLLAHAPASAERICVSTLMGCHPERYLAIQQALIDAARQGKCVVRLKGGDPLLFGRGGEEAEALRAAGILFEIVPGVTAGLAAAAFAGMPLTHRLHASAVAFVTGHEDPLKSQRSIDWAVLARFPGTLVLYMGMTRLPQIVAALIEHGKSADTPAAAVRWASTVNQQVVLACLAELPAAVRAAGLTAPALIVIGEVVALRDHLAWFEHRPLYGQTVLVSRPRNQAKGMIQRLEELGARVTHLPVVDIRAPADWGPVDAAIADLTHFNWLVFTSVNGVHAFIRRLRTLGRDLRCLGHLRFAVIGSETAAALRGYHLEPDLVPADFCSESLAADLKKRATGQRLLLARANRGRDLLREELKTVADVVQVVVYEQVDEDLAASPVLDALRRGEIRYLTVTSSNIAKALTRSFDAEIRARIAQGDIQLVSISPVTSAELRKLGFAVAAEAKEYTTRGLVEVLLGLVERSAKVAKSVPGQVEQHGGG